MSGPTPPVRVPPSNGSPFLRSEAEREKIREADAKVKEAELKKIVPEAQEYKPLAFFEIGRYTKGPCRGLFVAYQLVTEDEHGKPLKKPVKKPLCEGVDPVVMLSKIETAFRKRAFR